MVGFNYSPIEATVFQVLLYGYWETELNGIDETDFLKFCEVWNTGQGQIWVMAFNYCSPDASVCNAQGCVNEQDDLEGWAQDYSNSNIFLKPLFRGNLDPFVNNANLGAIARTKCCNLHNTFMVRRLDLGKNNHLTYTSLALNPRSESLLGAHLQRYVFLHCGWFDLVTLQRNR